jgi:hypothetical protein
MMNEAVAQLRVDQETQLSQMKEFYESQMNQIRQECAPRRELAGPTDQGLPQAADPPQVEEESKAAE